MGKSLGAKVATNLGPSLLINKGAHSKVPSDLSIFPLVLWKWVKLSTRPQKNTQLVRNIFPVILIPFKPSGSSYFLLQTLVYSS